MRHLLALFLAISIPGAAPAQVPADTLRIGLPSLPGPLDPVLDRSAEGLAVLSATCDTLLALEPDGTLVPRLADSFRLADDARTLHLTLRAGARFGDGRPVDATAVSASLTRAMKLPNSARRAELAPVDAIEIVDARTLVLQLDRPFAPLPVQLAGRAGMVTAPLTDGAEDGQAPDCAGPYRQLASDMRQIVLARDDAYWDAAAYGFARVVFLESGERALRAARVASGALDVAAGVAGDEPPPAGARWQIARVRGTGWRAILFNLAEPARSPYARDAGLRAGLAAALEGAAGLHAGAPAIDLVVPNRRETTSLAAALRDMADAHGFTLVLRILDPVAAARRVQNGDFAAALVEWPGRADADGDWHAHFHCRGAANDSGYCDAATDAALDTARAQPDPAERHALYAGVQSQLRADRPAIFLDPPETVFAVAARVGGFRPWPDGIVRLRGLEPRQP
jgi:peptide/nickel transport system substrate-binding protein